jgi:hypothetical protein
MLKFLKKEANKTTTENRAATYLTTQSDCLDLFATIGALRREPATEIKARFDRAWAEDPCLALKTLFFARDIRGGLGERDVFRTILCNMAIDRTDSIAKNLWAVPEFGRFDDFLRLLDTPAKSIVVDYLKAQFEADMTALEKDETVSLLGKWLPSVNAHNAGTVRYGKMIAKSFGMTEAEYRKALSKLRAKIAIIENSLRERDYTFSYAKQPSRAMMKYRKAFLRNDGERYKDFLSKVERGEAKLHTGTLMPYEIIRPAFGGYSIAEITADERRSMDVTWNAQENFTNGENALVVVDGSGSMYTVSDPMPATVALSLGIYFAECNTGAFKNHFITFSEKPQLVEIKGKDIFDKVKYASSFNEVANTNIQKVFELVLKTAVDNKLPQGELPSKIYVISDMEFDVCTKDADLTNFEYAKKLFAQHGYKLPDVVFWNVASRNTQQPVTMNENGLVLVSGTSPRVFSMVSSGNLSPYAFMMDTLSVERYAKIQV